MNRSITLPDIARCLGNFVRDTGRDKYTYQEHNHLGSFRSPW